MQLRKLILAGFKSFCDRTEFVFDDGITCVVGPNGCGKSNVVDAIKWVLGEQSAKSLRGTEMLDVIFNGSSARRPSGLAEVTLEFDNERGLLQPAVGPASDNKPHVVSVTRRLYRSGESEYLINGQVVRLRDIREMFMDTGVGATAYSLIEQGKVAELLQANPLDRRAIFEEAAGISRYKARKKEAIRKLERVEQNLLRLNDILAEVQKRLRSIKVQAGKARNYQTYAERLKELRGLSSLAQYHKLRLDRRELQNQIDQLHDQLTGVNSRIDQLEANRVGIESESNELERQARQIDGEIAGVSAQITTCEERIGMLTARCKELDDQVQLAHTRQRELQGRIASAEESIRLRQQEMGDVELHVRQCTEMIEAMLEEQQAGQLAQTKAQAELEDEKSAAIDLMRSSSLLQNEISGAGIRRESLLAQRQRLAARSEQIDQQSAQFTADADAFGQKLLVVGSRIQELTANLEQVKQQTLAAAQEDHALDVEISAAKEKRSALAARHLTLQEMQKQGQGVADGVRKILAARQKSQLSFVRGMLADFITTDFAHAAAIEAALAGRDQNLIVDSVHDLLAGRPELETVLKGACVEILCLDQLGPLQNNLTLAHLPVAARRITDFITVEARLVPAVWRLLGNTLLVDTLADARLAAAAAPHGYRFVTADGALIESDGRIRLGKPVASGVITRRSELQHLAAQIETLETTIADLTGRRQAARLQKAGLDETQQQLRTGIYEANAERLDYESRINRLREQLAQLQREQPSIARDIQTIAGEIEQTVQKEQAAREKLAELESKAQHRQSRIDELTALAVQARQRLDHLVSQLTERRVQHAQASEQRSALRETISRTARSIEHMQAECKEALSQIESHHQRKQTAEESIAAARASIEEFFQTRTALEQQAADIEESRHGLSERSEQIRLQLLEHRRRQESLSESGSKSRIEMGEADVRIENLITRATDELGLDLVAIHADYKHDEQQDWDAVNAEIQDLRGKIERLGNVNLDAIAEQEELESRESFLSGQLADINDSRRQLTDLINKINKQSRDLFVATFNAVRENFQIIFRKLFGGGKADIILANPDDVLESGIDIVARPPGKELRNISLLSGGEKTMTTVALLFSIFRSKPSPFCVLDEVDAALDEANNERFNSMVQEFLDLSQFIVITHSKRTMSIGDVLYGVTMQEPGVSRRVSVKFEEAQSLVEEDSAVAP